MRRAFFIGLAAALIAGCVSLDRRLASASTPLTIAQAAADFYVRDLGDNSCCVAIVTPRETVFAHAGAADEHALFRVASFTKLFLLEVFEKQAAEGRLDLGKSVAACSHLDLPPEYQKVTLRDLLFGRSGLPREFLRDCSPVDWWTVLMSGCFGTHLYAGFDSRTDFVRETWRPCWREAVRTPHEVYSNVGFGLLGLAVEDATGRTLADLVRTELVAPLHLADTAFEPAGDQTNRVTRACAGELPWLVRRGQDVPDHRLGEALRAAGGLFSSVSDCAKVFTAYWPFIDAQIKARPLEQFVPDADCGLLRVWIQPSGRRVLYRSGLVYGGASFVGFDLASRTFVVILRNVTSWPDAHGFEVLSALE